MSASPLPHNVVRIHAARERAAAIILAGGNSTRMGQDKALLPFQGRPLIAHIFHQLRPYFRQILVSANDPAKFSFLGAPIIRDKMPGFGPLMGIASALEASAYDRNFVLACDIPTIDMPFVQEMLRQAADFDCVVPMDTVGQIEPLFAVYTKDALDAIWSTLGSGERKIRNAFGRCRTRYVALSETDALHNINTANDYAQLLSRQPAVHTSFAARGI